MARNDGGTATEETDLGDKADELLTRTTDRDTTGTLLDVWSAPSDIRLWQPPAGELQTKLLVEVSTDETTEFDEVEGWLTRMTELDNIETALDLGVPHVPPGDISRKPPAELPTELPTIFPKTRYEG